MVNPVNGSSNVPVTTSIVWNQVATANSYKITVGYSSGGEVTANRILEMIQLILRSMHYITIQMFL
ncbi:MAG: hypothetical protein R2784_09775 [Saprospiraceae bacterium]